MVRICGLILILFMLSCSPETKVIRVLWAYDGDATYEIIINGEVVGILHNQEDLIYVEGQDSVFVIVKLVDENGNKSKGKLAVWKRK